MFFINGVLWRIVDVSPAHPILRRPNGGFSVGACDSRTKTIYINSRVKGAFRKKVLCHEVTHAAMFSYNVILTERQEELVAELIATFGNEIIYITDTLFYGIRGR